MKKKSTPGLIEAKILECKKRLKELSRDIDFDEEKSKEYNKIIVQKAILVDSYKKLRYKSTFSQKVKRTLSKMFRSKKEKLICDYFV